MKEIYFTRYDDGQLRGIEIMEQEMKELPGYALVRKTSGFSWKYRGHRGWYETTVKAIPHSEINSMEVDDEIKKDESAPIPISALSTHNMNNQSTAIVAENERNSK